MHPILFQLGSIVFYTHGVVTVLGILVGSWITYSLMRNNKITTEDLFDNVVIVLLAGIIGARLAYFLLYHDQFTSAWQFFQIWNGGLVSFGGFLFGLIALMLLLRSQAKPFWQYIDIFSVGFFVGLLIGRVGEIFAGEYAGVPSGSAILTFQHLAPVVIIPLWEGLLCFIIAATLITMVARNISRHKPGLVFLVGSLMYVVGRFIIDTGRAEQYSYHTITLGQIVCAALFVVLLIVLFIRKRSEYGTR